MQLLYFLFTKWLPEGQFGWPKSTFYHISRHFISIRNFDIFFLVFTKWLPAAILDDRKSLSIAFLANSDQYTFFFFKMATSGHFGSPICAKNNRVLPLCVINGRYEVDLWIYDTVRDVTSFLSIFIQNGHQRPFCFSDWCKNHRVLVIWDLNGYGEYEFDSCICGGGTTKNIISPKFSNFGDIIMSVKNSEKLYFWESQDFL